jgi:hypothetical protein
LYPKHTGTRKSYDTYLRSKDLVQKVVITQNMVGVFVYSRVRTFHWRHILILLVPLHFFLLDDVLIRHDVVVFR